MISQALRIHETTVHRHLIDYTLAAKLTPLNGGSSGYLTVIQTMVLIEHLTELHTIMEDVIQSNPGCAPAKYAT